MLQGTRPGIASVTAAEAPNHRVESFYSIAKSKNRDSGTFRVAHNMSYVISSIHSITSTCTTRNMHIKLKPLQ